MNSPAISIVIDAKEYHAALIFYDYLSKSNGIKFCKRVGIDIEQAAPPPPKKKKVKV